LHIIPYFQQRNTVEFRLILERAGGVMGSLVQGGRSPAFSLWVEKQFLIAPAGEWHVRKRKGGMRRLGADSAVGRYRRTPRKGIKARLR